MIKQLKDGTYINQTDHGVMKLGYIPTLCDPWSKLTDSNYWEVDRKQKYERNKKGELKK